MKTDELVAILKRLPAGSDVSGASSAVQSMLEIQLPDTAVLRLFGDGSMKVQRFGESDGTGARSVCGAQDARLQRAYRRRVARGRREPAFAELCAYEDAGEEMYQLHQRERHRRWEEWNRRRNHPTIDELRIDEAHAYDIDEQETAKAARRMKWKRRCGPTGSPQSFARCPALCGGKCREGSRMICCEEHPTVGWEKEQHEQDSGHPATLEEAKTALGWSRSTFDGDGVGACGYRRGVGREGPFRRTRRRAVPSSGGRLSFGAFARLGRV